MATAVAQEKVGAKAGKGKGGKGGKGKGGKGGSRMRAAMKKHSSVNGFRGIAAATAAAGKRTSGGGGGRLRRRGSVACLAAFKKDLAKQQRAGAFALDKNAHVQQRENDHCHNTTCILRC